jgi:transposase-like protein
MEEQQTRRPRRKFSVEFKRDLVEIVRSSDRSIAEVARELGIYDSSLGNRVRQDQIAEGSMACPVMTSRSLPSCGGKTAICG